MSTGLASDRSLTNAREGEPRIPAGADYPKESEIQQSFGILDKVRNTKLEEYLD